MATKFLNTALGVSNGGLAAWAVAGGAAYYFIYLPEQQKQQQEIDRAANAAGLMKGSQYLDFVKKHEAEKSGAKEGAKKGWLGGWFGRGGGSKEAAKQ